MEKHYVSQQGDQVVQEEDILGPLPAIRDGHGKALLPVKVVPVKEERGSEEAPDCLQEYVPP